MSKRSREQVADEAVGEYVAPAGDVAAEEPRLPDDAGLQLVFALTSSRSKLRWEPDPSLTGRVFAAVKSAAPAAALAVLVRNLERVVPLAAWHPDLGPPVRAAFQAGVDVCLRGGNPTGTSARSDWQRLATGLVSLLGTKSVDPALGTGAGQAAWAALYLLDAIASSAEKREWDQYDQAARAASAAVEAASPEPLRAVDRDRLTAANRRDLETLTTLGALADQAPVNPRESGPFGRLWVDTAPLIARIADAARATAAELTPNAESPNLAHVTTAQPTSKTQETSPPEPLSDLRAPDRSLSAKEALEELTKLLASVRSEHAPHLDQFRCVLKALAQHTFESREEAARVVQQLQAVRTLLGVGFVFLSDDAAKNGARVALILDTDARYPKGLIRAVRSTKPQEKLHSKVSLPELDVIDVSGES
jgi:hypothetical protein